MKLSSTRAPQQHRTTRCCSVVAAGQALVQSNVHGTHLHHASDNLINNRQLQAGFSVGGLVLLGTPYLPVSGHCLLPMVAAPDSCVDALTSDAAKSIAG